MKWNDLLHDEFEKPYFKELKEFVDNAYKTKECFPKKGDIMKAFRLTPFEKVKVVIIGQDPYHNVNQAHGLCFSVQDGVRIPPSLENIFKEIKDDIGVPIPSTGNLTRWAQQGVFLLNATLTVEAHQPGSHQRKGWEKFTDNVIHLLSEKRTSLIFLLWGGFAKKKAKLIDPNKHTILTSGHPSPLSANRGYWFGNKHFSQTNALLTKAGKNPINW